MKPPLVITRPTRAATLKAIHLFLVKKLSRAPLEDDFLLLRTAETGNHPSRQPAACQEEDDGLLRIETNIAGTVPVSARG